MATKAIIFLMVSFISVTTRVSSNGEEQLFMEDTVAYPPKLAPHNAPVPAPPRLAPHHAPAPAPIPHMPPVNISGCPVLCEERCKLHSRPRHCKRVCGTCCQRCKCVPPGTYGNREKCGKCYTDMTTHGGKLKCP